MKKIAIVTDSNSGITQSSAEQLGISVLPMPFMMGSDTFFEDINLSQEMFYQKLGENVEVSTSQPSVGALLDLWNKLLEEHDELVYFPMSAGLSASCETAIMLSADYDGRVQVVDNRRVSVILKQSVLDALTLARAGWDALRIKEHSERVRADASIYLMVDSLKYLKKGGRITPAAAAIGSILNIKPVLQIQQEKLDLYAKARGVKQARKIMIDALRKDFETRFADCACPEKMSIFTAYTYNKDAAVDFTREVEESFPGFKVEYTDPLSLSVSCHTGPGLLGLLCAKKLEAQTDY